MTDINGLDPTDPKSDNYLDRLAEQGAGEVKRQKDIPEKTRDAVRARSGGICEGCGRRRASDIHHRRYKSRGGGHELSNLLHLCGGAGGMAGGNHSGCHGAAHKGGEGLGWSVESGYRPPSDYPVKRRGEWVHLRDDGTWQTYEEGERE